MRMWTSQNAVKAKFAEFPFHDVGCIRLRPAPLGQETPKREILAYGFYAPVQRVKPKEGSAVQSPTRLAVTRSSEPDATTWGSA